MSAWSRRGSTPRRFARPISLPRQASPARTGTHHRRRHRRELGPRAAQARWTRRSIGESWQMPAVFQWLQKTGGIETARNATGVQHGDRDGGGGQRVLCRQHCLANQRVGREMYSHRPRGRRDRPSQVQAVCKVAISLRRDVARPNRFPMKSRLIVAGSWPNDLFDTKESDGSPSGRASSRRSVTATFCFR